MVSNIEFELLTDEELKLKAKELNVKICPITTTTRKTVIIKLKKAIECGIEKELNKNENILKKLPDPKTNKIEEKIEEKIEKINIEMTKLSLQSTPNRNLQENSKFYTIYYSNEIKIVNSLKEVSENAKIYPNLRFKKFSSYDEASSFMESFNYDSLNESQNNKEKNEKFKNLNGIPVFRKWSSISSKLIRKYRFYVEKGQIQKILLFCLDNPRYLISSIDTPVILHEGSRKNAFHIAAEKNQPNVIKILLYLLRNNMWCKACHFIPINTDDEQINFNQIIKNVNVKDCVKYTIDMYLNSPDKIIYETPLHIACKYGNILVVEILLNQPEIIKNLKNKFLQTPYDVICSRYDNDDQDFIRNKIKLLFKKI